MQIVVESEVCDLMESDKLIANRGESEVCDLTESDKLIANRGETEVCDSHPHWQCP